MLWLPQGFNSVPAKSSERAVAAPAASEVGSFHPSRPQNHCNPRENRTAGILLLCRETRKPRRILNPQSSDLHTALSITRNLTRVNRNTQARGRSLPTCTNTLAWDPRWVFPPGWELEGAAAASPRKCHPTSPPIPPGFWQVREEIHKRSKWSRCSPAAHVRGSES